MNTHHEEDRLRQAIDALPRDMQPERDLWPGIEHAIQPPLTTPWYRQAALAASIVLVLGLSIHFGLNQPEVTPVSPRVLEYIASLQAEHESSKEALLVRYTGQEAVYEDWREQMTQLEQAEQVIYEALRKDPDNMELVRILRQVQSKQIQLIDAVFDPRRNSI